jgi:hypothetical protein
MHQLLQVALVAAILLEVVMITCSLQVESCFGALLPSCRRKYSKAVDSMLWCKCTLCAASQASKLGPSAMQLIVSCTMLLRITFERTTSCACHTMLCMLYCVEQWHVLYIVLFELQTAG